jgi:hypothetical protein
LIFVRILPSVRRREFILKGPTTHYGAVYVRGLLDAWGVPRAAVLGGPYLRRYFYEYIDEIRDVWLCELENLLHLIHKNTVQRMLISLTLF